jgi:hypothetical protein
MKMSMGHWCKEKEENLIIQRGAYLAATVAITHLKWTGQDQASAELKTKPKLIMYRNLS